MAEQGRYNHYDMCDCIYSLYIVISGASPSFFNEWMTISFPNPYSMETFYVQGKEREDQYMIFTSRAHSNLSVYSLEYNSDIKHIQTLTVSGVHTSRAVYINGSVYIAAACCCDEEGIVNHPSRLYLWNGKSLVFKQNISTWFAGDVSYAYTKSNEVLLAFTTQDVSCISQVYKWNSRNQLFEHFQSISVNGASRLHFFYTPSQQLCLSIACSYGKQELYHSFVYKWNGTAFAVMETIRSYETNDLLPLVCGNKVYLIGAHFTRHSMVYRWNGNSFEEFQSLDSTKGSSADWFTINDQQYIAIASKYNTKTETSLTKSVIYKFDGSTFDTFQEIPAVGAASVKGFPTIWGHHILGVLNEIQHDVILYKWQDTSPQSVCN